MDIFSRFAPFIQDFIYANHWDRLRAIQVAAGDVLFNTNDNLLLAAATASGKTEAAFFPILTLFDEDPPQSVGALYIGPTKALINDQFLRLDALCAEAGIPVRHWHGDVARSRKEKLLKNPAGILQITPESLEALLMRRHGAIARLFHDLRFVVIDEAHALLRGDRGGQALCGIERIARIAGANPRRIGLSATIGDPEAVGAFLSLGTGRKTAIPKIEEQGVRWRLSMEHFFIHGPQASQGPLHEGAAERSEAGGVPRPQDAAKAPVLAKAPLTASSATPSAPPGHLPLGGRLNVAPPPGELSPKATEGASPPHADPGLAYIFQHTKGRKCLVFTNSREECETVTATLRQYCAAVGEPDRFLIHHGNLSAAIRESAEAAMRDDAETRSIMATATLELGIDIGKLERAFHIDAPFTVAGFLQRLGRTGRRGQPPEMRFVMREDEAEPRAMLPATLPWKLLQGIALVQLYLEERWVEPPRLDRLPYSLLYHQTISALAAEGETRPAELAAKVLKLAVFRRVSQEDFRALLHHLLATDHVQQTERGGLILGLAGERRANSFKFFAVFQENEEYSCRSGGQEIGTIVRPPPVGDKIALAGHVWIVEEIDHKRRLIYCERVPGRVPAFFGLCPGDIHTKILARMRQVLLEDADYPYLLPNARARLAPARLAARHSGLDAAPLVNLGGDMWCLFPWLGTYAFLALERFLKLKYAPRLGLSALDSSRPYFMQFKMRASAADFFRITREEAAKDFDPLELVYPGEVPLFDKYDEFLPEALVKKGFAHAVLDIAGMRARIAEWG